MSSHFADAPVGRVEQARKEILTARVLLVVVGILTAAANIYFYSYAEQEVREAVDKELEAVGGRANVPPENQRLLKAEEARILRLTKTFYIIFTTIGVVFVGFSLCIKLYPVPITISALVLYVAGHAVYAALDAETILRGLAIKICIVAALAKAIQAAIVFEVERRALGRRREQWEDELKAVDRQAIAGGRFASQPQPVQVFVQLDCSNCGQSYSLPTSECRKKMHCQYCREPIAVDPALVASAADDDAVEIVGGGRRRRDRFVEERRHEGSSMFGWVICGVVLLSFGGVGLYFVMAEKKKPADNEVAADKPVDNPQPKRPAFNNEKDKDKGKDGGPKVPAFPIDKDKFKMPVGINPPIKAKIPIEPPPPPFKFGQPDPPVAAARLDLPPLPEQLEIKPAPIKDVTPYALPEAVTGVRVAGGGRFLLLHFPKVRKIGVFDVNEAKIVRYVSAAEEGVVFAGGMSKLLVYSPSARILERYDLLTGDREKLGKIELPDGKVESFSMGSASSGPLLIGVQDRGGQLYDIETFKIMPLPRIEQAGINYNQSDRLPGGQAWAATNGRAFVCGGVQIQHLSSFSLSTDKIVQHGDFKHGWSCLPGPDGKHVYVIGHGIYTERMARAPNVPEIQNNSSSGHASILYLPAVHGPYYFHADTIDFGLNIKKKATGQGTITIYMHGDALPIATVPNTVVHKSGDWMRMRDFGVEQTIHLIPKAKLLAVIPAAHNEIRLYPIDLDAALAKLDREFLTFVSIPPVSFQKGKTFDYETDAKAKRQPVTYRLESAPKGMTVTTTGAVRWEVPETFAEERVDVILVARDAGGLEAFHTFTLTSQPTK